VKNLQMIIKLVVGVALAIWGVTLMTGGEAAAWQIALVLGAAFFLIVWFLLDLFSMLGMKDLAEQYTTYDIMVMAVLIAAGGVVKAYWGQVRMILESIMGPYATFIIGPGF